MELKVKSLNRENLNQKLAIQIPGITNNRWKCENQFARSKCAPGSYNWLQYSNNNYRHTKQQHLGKCFKRNSSLFLQYWKRLLFSERNDFSVLRLMLKDSCLPRTVVFFGVMFSQGFVEVFMFSSPSRCQHEWKCASIHRFSKAAKTTNTGRPMQDAARPSGTRKDDAWRFRTRPRCFASGWERLGNYIIK